MPVMSNLSSDGKELTISIKGHFEFKEHKAFRDAYHNGSSSPTRYVVDFSETDYMDSAALGMLLLLREYAGGESSAVRLTNATPYVSKVLALANFQRLFTLG